jgi:DHA2 family multidrug resistance protein-like MFS transporter
MTTRDLADPNVQPGVLEVPSPGDPRLPVGLGSLLRQKRVHTLGLLTLSFGLVALDNTKLVAAMPTLARVYGESPALHWVVEAGLLFYASLLLLGGSLAEQFGARRMLCAGLLLLGAGSLGAAWVSSVPALVVLRIVTGSGAALITPSTLSTVKHLFDERERPVAISVWTAAYGIFATAGPLVSGWVLDRFAPTAIFLVNVPLVLVALVLAVRLVPGDLPRHLVPLDVTSAGLAFAGTASLLYAILEGPALGLAASSVRTAVVLTAIFYAALGFWQTRARHPLLDPALLRELRFRYPLGIILLGYLAFSGTAFVLTQAFQVARGHSPFDAGLFTMPLTLSLLTGTLLAPGVMKRQGPARAIVASVCLAAAGAGLLAVGNGLGSDWVLSLFQVPFGLGCGCTFVNATEFVLGVAPSERAGTAAAVNEGAFEFGGVLGVAVLGAALGSPLLPSHVFAAHATVALWIGCASYAGAAVLAVRLRGALKGAGGDAE